MSECRCTVYHPQDYYGSIRIAEEMARDSDPRIAAAGKAMLAPCPWREGGA